MGKQKHLEHITALFQKSPVVDFPSIERVIGKTSSSNYAKLLISNLLKKNKIIRLSKGYYTSYNEISLVVFCFKPAYLGLHSALSYHNLWEQETIPVVLTTRKVRTGLRRIGGSNILVRHIDNKSLFGYEYVKDGDFYLPYSDLEKTLIDFAVFKEKISEEALKKLRQRIKKRKLQKYLKHYSAALRQRVMFLFEKRE